MPDHSPEYPPGYDPTFDFEMPPTGYVIMGLVALAAISAAATIGAFIEYATAAAIAGDVVSAGVAEVLATTGVSEAEALIAEEILAAGGTEADVQVFIFNMARQRALDALMSEAAATDLATAEAAAVTATALQNASTITAAIILASARVNEQSALHAFFTSGL